MGHYGTRRSPGPRSRLETERLIGGLVVRGWPVRAGWSWPYGGVGDGGGDAGEQAQAFFGVAAGLGVVGDQGLHGAARDEQPFVVERQRSDLRVVEQAGAGGPVLDVLPGPQRA